MSSNTVSAGLSLRLVASQHVIMPLVGSLSYSREDPYAIRTPAPVVDVGEPVPLQRLHTLCELSHPIQSAQADELHLDRILSDR